VELEPEENEASGICFKTDSDAELGPGFLSVAKDWERGQHIGSESFQGRRLAGHRHQWWRRRGRRARGELQVQLAGPARPGDRRRHRAGWTYKPKKL
jgi:hypothetical protein